MRKFLIYLSGGRPDVLDQVPGELSAFVLRGLTVLVTSILLAAGIAWSLVQALNIGFVPAALAGGIVWLVEIFLQRLLVIPGASRRRRMAFLIPSLCTSIALAALLVPLLLSSIFRTEIAYQLTVMQVRAASAFQAEQSSSAIATQARALQDRVTALQQVIDTGGGSTLNPATDPTLTTLQKQLKQAQTTAATAYAEWECQLYGIPLNGVSCLAGNGPTAAAAQATYNNDRDIVANLQHQVTAREAQLESDSASARAARVETARQQLPDAQAALNQVESELNLQRSEFNAANDQNTGLAARFQALNDLADANDSVRIAMLLGYVLCVLIACLPGLLALLQTSAGYEGLLAATERQEALRAHYRLRVLEEADVRLVEAFYRAADRAPGQGMPPLPAEASPGEQLDRSLRHMRDMRQAGHPDGEQAGTSDVLDGLA
jgi:hypothetical protein